MTLSMMIKNKNAYVNDNPIEIKVGTFWPEWHY